MVRMPSRSLTWIPMTTSRRTWAPRVLESGNDEFRVFYDLKGLLRDTPSQGLQNRTAQVRVTQRLKLLLDLSEVQREIKVVLELPRSHLLLR